MEPPPSTRLAGRRAALFGAGSSGPGWGNGKAAAVAYARAGAAVACIDLVRAAAEETAGIIAAEGGRAVALAADVTDEASVAAAVAEAAAALGGLDLLHNNVGHAAMGGPEALDLAAWRRAFDLNLNGAYLAIRHALPHLKAAGRPAAIVNVSSLAAIRWTGYPYAAYMAAKAALNQLTVAVALEYARAGIRANAIMPGKMDTPLIYRQIAGQYASAAEMVRQRNESCPMGRMGTAWDVANAAVFLASDEAGYITGQCLAVDGGAGCVAP
jgi:NAD(P)-dependent dehydrogenase (short-subunit alcohol dehydrogenase family)